MAKNGQSKAFHKWATQFVRWVRGLFGAGESSPTRVVVESHFTNNAALYRFHESRVPGCVDCWKLVRSEGSSGDWLLVLINLAAMRQEVGERRHGRGNGLEFWQNELASGIEAQFDAQSQVAATHLVFIGWVKEHRYTDRNGRSYRRPRVEFVGLWACDLQGAGGPIRGDRYACHICEVIAKRLLRLETKWNTWEEVVNAIPWLEWLEFYAQHTIHKDHVLQPKKATKKPPPK